MSEIKYSKRLPADPQSTNQNPVNRFNDNLLITAQLNQNNSELLSRSSFSIVLAILCGLYFPHVITTSAVIALLTIYLYSYYRILTTPVLTISQHRQLQKVIGDKPTGRMEKKLFQYLSRKVAVHDAFLNKSFLINKRTVFKSYQIHS